MTTRRDFIAGFVAAAVPLPFEALGDYAWGCELPTTDAFCLVTVLEILQSVANARMPHGTIFEIRAHIPHTYGTRREYSVVSVTQLSAIGWNPAKGWWVVGNGIARKEAA